MALPTSDDRLHISFVCTGNICRSPMGDVILNAALIEAHLETEVLVDSCGMGGWHVGQKADKRALRELASAGYDGSAHRASQIDEANEAADLLIAMDSGHVSDLVRFGVPRERIRLLRSFDPAAGADLDVEDPYYGSAEDFTLARTQIEHAIPGILSWIRTQIEA
ncbi:low molecular weight protein-tyrosine-phosphatase [Corynebacterium vitaeruminis]|uniref:low molecular weight protein-tyrosine-phosphatase n=1 Tax=Corynebacterium vitaeruminis TaxID=38305 RepID=UPI0023F32AC7|nr:low molecular weight protein-tyrosine-phosphatase [Corynebacterium vitaeruminis]